METVWRPRETTRSVCVFRFVRFVNVNETSVADRAALEIRVDDNGKKIGEIGQRESPSRLIVTRKTTRRRRPWTYSDRCDRITSVWIIACHHEAVFYGGQSIVYSPITWRKTIILHALRYCPRNNTAVSLNNGK